MWMPCRVPVLISFRWIVLESLCGGIVKAPVWTIGASELDVVWSGFLGADKDELRN